MNSLVFVTGNEVKLRLANEICKPLGIHLEQAVFDIPEVQAETGESVAKDKAAQAFKLLQKPLVVTDDTWVIPALNGFPGPYMKYMNHWFTSEDWLRLTRDLPNREIVLRQIAVYQDEYEQVVFSVDITGTLLPEIRGESKYPHNTIASFDNGEHSIAELQAEGKSGASHHHTVWHELAKWLHARSVEA